MGDGNALVRTLTLVAAIGAAVNAGVFFSFSTFTMAGLRDAPTTSGIEVMQSINRAAPQPPFMAVLFGTALACVGVGIAALAGWGDAAATLGLVGACCYLVAIVVTVAYHVPRNDALAALDPATAEAATYWTRYLAEWVRVNHVRTLAPAAGAVLLTLSWQAHA
jgi:uncharacterized membrane protein